MSKKSERVEALWRILIGIVTGIILEIWAYLILVLGILNWIVTIFTGKRHKGMADLCEYWNTEMYKYFRYLTGVSNERPFPFSDVERLSKFKK